MSAAKVGLGVTLGSGYARRPLAFCQSALITDRSTFPDFAPPPKAKNSFFTISM